MNRLKYIFLTLLFFSHEINAEQLPMGSWRTHFAYNQIKQIAQSEDKVYAVSNDGALYSVGKYDDAIDIYSKIYGLNDNVASYIKYSINNDVLVIVYDNSNIDLLTNDGEIFNIPDIYNKNIGHSKKINDICFDGKYAYLACDFGIVVLDLKRYEIKDTYIIGDEASYVSILNVSINKDIIYAATSSQLYYANLEKDNLLNYQNWKPFSSIPNGTIRNFAFVNNTAYILTTDNNLHEYKNNQWSKIIEYVRTINADKDELWCTMTYNYIHNVSQSIAFDCSAAYNAEYDNDDKSIVWFSDNRGIGKHFLNEGATSFFKPSGPISKQSWRIKYADGRMFVVPGGRWTTEYTRDGELMIYENGTWKNYDNTTLKALSDYRVTDLLDVAIDPNDKTHFYVASYGSGILEFKNDQLVNHYTAHNSDVETVFSSSSTTSSAFNNYHRVDGLRFDSKGNLWFLNVGTALIKYLTPNGQFVKLSHDAISKFETNQDIIFHPSKENLKFVLSPRSTGTTKTGLFVFDDKGTATVNDDQTRLFTNFKDQDGKLFKPTNFHCIEQEKDGAIWIGTTTGLAVIGNTNKIFDQELTVNRIKIPRNDGTGLADYLLGTERINDIAIDGANRKWFATESSGVFLTSSDGLETIHHFTVDNSPLLSNNVQCIGINEKTGEVFFGTSNGIISYQSDAKEGGDQFENVHAFPNPVRPDYDGLISITGLIDGATIRITDVNGYVVYETLSNGGIATWDGKIKSGRRAATGVYVVMCVDSSGKKHATTKILFIN